MRSPHKPISVTCCHPAGDSLSARAEPDLGRTNPWPAGQAKRLAVSRVVFSERPFDNQRGPLRTQSTGSNIDLNFSRSGRIKAVGDYQ